MRKYFFNETITATIYLLFIAAFPFLSVIVQFCFDDRTMYLSYLVAGIAMVYDHAILLKEKVGKRLWFEAIISIVSAIIIAVIAVVKIMQILSNLPNADIVPYGGWDVIFICFLGIIVGINLIEFILYIRHDYKLRFSTNTPQNSNLLIGASKI